jgi:hypothetical protein
MKKLLLASPLLLGLAGCASSGGGGVPAGVLFADCYDDYCVGYDTANLRHLYLRTPGTPQLPQRGEVQRVTDGRGDTQTVTRASASPVVASWTQSQAGPQTAPAPAAPRSSSSSSGRH